MCLTCIMLLLCLHDILKFLNKDKDYMLPFGSIRSLQFHAWNCVSIKIMLPLVGWSHDHMIPIELFRIGKFLINENHSSIRQYLSIRQYCKNHSSIGQYSSIGRYCENLSSIGQYSTIGQYSPISQSEILAGRSCQTNEHMRQLIGHTNQQSNINCDCDGWFTSATF